MNDFMFGFCRSKWNIGRIRNIKEVGENQDTSELEEEMEPAVSTAILLLLLFPFKFYELELFLRKY